MRLGPPRTCKVPSPPSAIGALIEIPPHFLTAVSIALAASTAVKEPRNLSGAAKTRTFTPNRKSLYRIPRIQLHVLYQPCQHFRRVQKALQEKAQADQALFPEYL